MAFNFGNHLSSTSSRPTRIGNQTFLTPGHRVLDNENRDTITALKADFLLHKLNEILMFILIVVAFWTASFALTLVTPFLLFLPFAFVFVLLLGFSPMAVLVWWMMLPLSVRWLLCQFVLFFTVLVSNLCVTFTGTWRQSFVQVFVFCFLFSFFVITVASPSRSSFSVLFFICLFATSSFPTSSPMPAAVIISLSAPVLIVSLSVPVLFPVSIPRSIWLQISASDPVISPPASVGSLGSPATVEWGAGWWQILSVVELISWIVVHM